jgi:enoyl-CoA hydratase
VTAGAHGGRVGRTLEVAVRGRIMTATLANPPANLLTHDLLDGLDQVLDRFERDEADVLLLAGAGRVFSKGFDVAALEGLAPAAMRDALAAGNAVLGRLARSPKLTVAAIGGACLGGGLELALACHLRLCAAGARLGLPEVWIGLVPGLGGVQRLAGLVGHAKALELVALGDLVTATEALRLNLVTRVYPDEQFDAGVTAFLDAITAAPPAVLRHVIALAAAPSSREDDGVRASTESFLALWSSRPRTLS